MSSFFVDLWESIFTPGPTPSILKATNISFAALQLVLFGLLLATHSVHCVVLSILCAGLWWSVNWFASELAAHQARERAETDKIPPIDPKGSLGSSSSSSSEDEAGEETEVENTTQQSIPSVGGVVGAGVEPLEKHGDLKHRAPPTLAPVSVPPAPATQSSVSTEDEWEKVSENENEKDK